MKSLYILFSLLLVFATLSLSCTAHKKAVAARESSKHADIVLLVDASADAAQKSQNEKDRGKARDLAIRGKEQAERCAQLAPNEAACFYWRAVNTGLFHRVHIVGYQKGVKQMIADCQRVIELDPNFDHAGAYRILGELYTQLPQTGGAVDSITRDLELAEDYLHRAVLLAPDYPENYLSLAKTLFEREKFTDAVDALTKAHTLAPEWRSDYSYNAWQDTIVDLKKKLAKANK